VSRRLRIYGVVVPVPGGIARIANRIRRRYDPYFLRIGPHVTVLPPRPLPLTHREIGAEVARIAASMEPFDVALGSVRSFLPAKPVLFAGVRRGRSGFERLHRRLARGPLRGEESFPFVPHLTLGRIVESDRFRRALAAARRQVTLAAFRVPWKADRLLVVERRTETRWIALPDILLAGPATSVARRNVPRRRSGS
jgi:2'-5' RNA ligase